MSIERRAAVFEYGSVVDTHVLRRAPIYAVWTSIEYIRTYYIYREQERSKVFGHFG